MEIRNGGKIIIVIFSISAAIIACIAIGVFVLLHYGSAGGSAKYGADGIRESKFAFAGDISDRVLYPVEHVIDGDTLIVRAGADEVTIRLIGIDTPETVDPRKPVQCYGPEASAKAKELLASTSVYLEKDPLKGDYDKYGRVLAYVKLADGSSYNEYMLQNGFAHEYTYFKEAYKYQAAFKADEAAAKKAKMGLWAKCSK